VIALLATMIAVPTAQADDLKDRQKQVRKHIKKTEAHLEEASAQLTRAMHLVDRARARLNAAQAKYRQTRARLDRARAVDRKVRAQLVQARADLETAREDLRQGRIAVAQQRTDIGLMAASNYQNGDPRLMQLVVVMKSQSPSDMVTQMQAVDNLMGREERTLVSLKERRDALVEKEQRVEQAEQRVAARKEETEANVVRMQQLTRVATRQKSQVERLVAKRKKVSERARKIRARDLRNLREFKRRETAILAKIRRQAALKRNYKGNTGGFLSRPVPGAVTSPFGYRRHPIYGYWGLHNGTDFRVSCGQPMAAAAGGRVAAIYYDSVYGNRLFLDVGRVNGRSMTLIYNHMSGYKVGVGARVGRGQVVGYAGTTGWSTGCHLHFSVTSNGRYVNPLNYM
jgi:murein DD-endopeptidase MepM/ murein hydrolase activator NlpD